MEMFKINSAGLITNKAGVQVDKERVLQIIKAATKSLETAPARQALPTQTAIPTPESEAFQAFKQWICENACMVAKMKMPFTEDEFLKVCKLSEEKHPGFKWGEIKTTLRDMHNWAELTKKCTSAYATLIKWITRKQEKLHGIYK